MKFFDTNRLFNFSKTTRPSDNQQRQKKKKKREPTEYWLSVPADDSVKLKESEKRDKYLEFARELQKTMEHESDGDSYCYWCVRFSHQRIGTGTGGLGKKRTSGGHLNYTIVRIGQNTEKSPGDWSWLVVTQTQWKPSANTDVKTLKRLK